MLLVSLLYLSLVSFADVWSRVLLMQQGLSFLICIHDLEQTSYSVLLGSTLFEGQRVLGQAWVSSSRSRTFNRVFPTHHFLLALNDETPLDFSIHVTESCVVLCVAPLVCQADKTVNCDFLSESPFQEVMYKFTGTHVFAFPLL